MTPQEFKAWFEGYSEGIEDAPSQRQWKRIKARVAEIDGITTTTTIFRERYYPSYPYPYPYLGAQPIPWGTITMHGAVTPAGVSGGLMNTSVIAEANPIASAFCQLGMMDAKNDLTIT